VLHILGSGNTLTIYGACGLVSVNGDKNVVTINLASTLRVPGDDNTVHIAYVDAIHVGGNRDLVGWHGGITDKESITVTVAHQDSKVIRE
jgi:hypothetical protein